MPDHLKFGVTSINTGATSYPEALVQLAQAAEAAGFESLWAGEHSVLAESSTRMPATNRILNPIVALTFVAAHTRTIRLGTGVLLFPQHQPLILAKELATLDVLSSGRLMVGVGVGWSEEEFEAVGVPFRERGARADEYLDAMRAIWSQEKPAYHGRYVSFQGVQAFPHPVQQPTPPSSQVAERPRSYAGRSNRPTAGMALHLTSMKPPMYSPNCARPPNATIALHLWANSKSASLPAYQ